LRMTASCELGWRTEPSYTTKFPSWLPIASHNALLEGFQRTFFLWLGPRHSAPCVESDARHRWPRNFPRTSFEFLGLFGEWLAADSRVRRAVTMRNSLPIRSDVLRKFSSSSHVPLSRRLPRTLPPGIRRGRDFWPFRIERPSPVLSGGAFHLLFCVCWVFHGRMTRG
jgi:hypothetical protein